MLKLNRVQFLLLVLVVVYVVFGMPSAFAGAPEVAGINAKETRKVLNKSSKLNTGFSLGTVNFFCGPKSGATMSQKEAKLLFSIDTKRPNELQLGSRVCQVFVSKTA